MSCSSSSCRACPTRSCPPAFRAVVADSLLLCADQALAGADDLRKILAQATAVDSLGIPASLVIDLIYRILFSEGDVNETYTGLSGQRFAAFPS